MANYSDSAIKKANLILLIYAFTSIIFNAVVIILQFNLNDFAKTIASLGGILSIFIPFSAIAFLNAVTDPSNKDIRLKLVPLAFVPAAIYEIAVTTFASFLGLFPVDKLFEGFSGDLKACAAALSSLLGAAVGIIALMTISKKLCLNYLEFFFRNPKLVFPKEYKLKNKWWFSVVAYIVWGVLSAIPRSLMYFVIHNNEVTGAIEKLFNAIDAIATLAIAYAFFNIAFNKIDKSTRKLFYPFITLDYILGTAITGAASPIWSVLNNPSVLAESSSRAAKLSLLSMIYTGDLLIITTVLYIYIARKSLGAFEAKEIQSVNYIEK